jgi:DNA-binding MarR family transcriptional regulator
MSEATTVSSAPRWLDAGEQAAWRAYLNMNALLTARLNREMQDESGISISDFSVLVALSEHAEGRMRVLELARALGWEKSRLSHQLTRMQQRGLVERSNCNEDRRGAFVVLTDQGLS